MPIPELMAGWARFRQGRFREQRDLYERLAREGQRPRVLMISCCDSRVDPAIVFDCDPGDIFVVRNVANLVPPYEQSGSYHGTSAAIEFAVRVLEVRHIVVLGHAQCGGMRALLDGPPLSDPPMRFLPAWIGIADEARKKVLAEPGLDEAARVRRMEEEGIRLSLDNLRTFKTLRAAEESGALHLHGWHFDIRDAALRMFDAQSGGFVAPPG